MTFKSLLPLCTGSVLLLSGLSAQAASAVRDGFAVMNADGTLVRSSSNVNPSKHLAGSGIYQVFFDHSLSKCAFVASLGSGDATPPLQGFVTVEPGTGAGQHTMIVVNTFDVSGQPADFGFHAIARC